MLLSAVSVLVVAQSSSEIPEGLMNNPVYIVQHVQCSSEEQHTGLQHVKTLKRHVLSSKYAGYVDTDTQSEVLSLMCERRQLRYLQFSRFCVVLKLYLRRGDKLQIAGVFRGDSAREVTSCTAVCVSRTQPFLGQSNCLLGTWIKERLDLVLSTTVNIRQHFNRPPSCL